MIFCLGYIVELILEKVEWNIKTLQLVTSILLKMQIEPYDSKGDYLPFNFDFLGKVLEIPRPP